MDKIPRNTTITGVSAILQLDKISRCQTTLRTTPPDNACTMGIVTILTTHWHQLAEQPVDWPEPPLGGAATAGAVLARISANPDATLYALVLRAQAGERLAGEIVLHAMLPKLCALAATDSQASIDDYVASFWLVLMHYPLQRQQKVAANLALDTRKAVHAQRPKLVALPSLVEAEPEPGAQEILEQARELQLLSDDAHALLHAVYIDGASPRSIAQQHRRSAAAVRQTCSRAVRRLATHRSEFLAA